MSNTKRLFGFPVWLLLSFIGFMLFVPFIGNVHLFDWDEVNFAESAREMLLTHNYRMVQINFQPFYEKPPFFIWLQALSMGYFGVNEFAARFPNAVCGIATLITVYNAGKRYFDEQFGIWWALLFACSVLPQLYFKSGIIDPVFNYFIFLSLYLLFVISIKDEFEAPKLRRRNHRRYLIISAVAAGIAVLVKGPVALALIVITISAILIFNRGKLNFNFTDLLVWLFVIIVVIGAWLSFEIRANGITFIDNFLAYQIRLFTTEDAGHGGPFYFHILALLLGCFPASVFCLSALNTDTNDTHHQQSFKRWMLMLLLVVVLVFSAVRTKIIHYSSLAYFPITFLGAYYLHQFLTDRRRWGWWQNVSILLISVVFAMTVACAISIGAGLYKMPFEIKDQFALEALKATVSWNLTELIVPLLYILLILLSIIYITRKRTLAGLGTLLISTGLFTNLMMSLIAPRIERYSQSAMIEFLESKKTEDCYIQVLGFKSYAQYFYFDKKPPQNRLELDQNYLLSGPATKPVYVITRINKLDGYYQPEKFRELYRKNGYVFFVKLK